MPHDRQWAPLHSIMATPLLVAFELLLCIHLERRYAVNLKIVFLPLLALETAILVDNIRMCRSLMPGDDESINDEAIWETLPVMSLALVGGIYLSIMVLQSALPFLFAPSGTIPQFTGNVRYFSWTNGAMVASEDDNQESRMCSLHDIGGHVMKIPLIGFQVLLFMYLEGTPPGAKDIPIPLLVSPLLLLQGAGLLFAIFMFYEKVILLVHDGSSRRFFRLPPSAYEYMGSCIVGQGCWAGGQLMKEVEKSKLGYIMPGNPGIIHFHQM